MQLRIVMLKVNDQDKALKFYTDILGFRKKHDIPGQFRWLTVESPDGPTGVELVLESTDLPPALAAQKALYDGGFPAAILTTDDIARDFRLLTERGVIFQSEPKTMQTTSFAAFDDTCGNKIMLSQSILT